jgi:hypothetical protein
MTVLRLAAPEGVAYVMPIDSVDEFGVDRGGGAEDGVHTLVNTFAPAVESPRWPWSATASSTRSHCANAYIGWCRDRA